ncbi:phosphoenolpyruvate--protein phosphotransferase [Bremerella sp. JC817]|uniref:phosphoenolpyruvate--protein phosphotransferase n=1 Tax=Bremerella sp. JC817 TaxID=3231756 RepID=UPI003459E6DF
MKILTGTPISPGFAGGIAIIYDFEGERRIELPQHPISDVEIELEGHRVDDALAQSTHELTSIEEQTNRLAERLEATEVLSAHATIAQELAALVRKQIASDRINAEGALNAVVQEFATRFQQLDSNYLREREQDVRDVGHRLLRHLLDPSLNQREPLPKGSVVVARELLPSETIELVNSGVVAILTEFGGPLSHTAIIARSLGIPGISGIPEITSCIEAGTNVLVDGETGCIELNPSRAVESRFWIREKLYEKRHHASVVDEQLPCITADGTTIQLLGNIGIPLEAPEITKHNLAGVGLFRTEFLFLESAKRPSLAEQVEIYSGVSKSLNNRPLTLRTFDLGSDKLPPFLQSSRAETNSMLALRGLRFSLKEVELLNTQLKAILQVGRTADVRILFPMVIGPDDFSLAIDAVRNATGFVGIQQRPQIGAMIETPAALFALDEILELADFVAIGTNDLTQYMLAVDRDLAEGHNDCTAMHPAVLRAIRWIVKKARTHNCPVCVCGEEASNIDFARLLIGLGIRELSLAPSRAADVRHALRSVDCNEAKKIASLALKCLTTSSVHELCKRF